MNHPDHGRPPAVVLHAPGPAIFREPSRQHAPGLCESDDRERTGWFVPIRKRKGRRDAVIRLMVQDPHSSFYAPIAFLIDTGAEQTVIPRRALRGDKWRAFQQATSGPSRVLKSPTGTVWAQCFDATLELRPAAGDEAKHFSFGTVTTLIPDRWPRDIPALLGLDLLRQLILIADETHVSLWEPSDAGGSRANVPGTEDAHAARLGPRAEG